MKGLEDLSWLDLDVSMSNKNRQKIKRFTYYLDLWV